LRRGNAVSRLTVIACDKREAFAQGSTCDEAIQLPVSPRERWIASRSLSSGAHSRDPLARNDDRFGCLKIESGYASANAFVMPGLDPGIHPSSQQTLSEEEGSPGQARS
jgi:hypothetical protein